jgi:Rrf2 family protein
MNRKVEYALMALKHMSDKVPGELTTAKEVSESMQTPFDATARVMQVMSNRGLLRSEQGAFGGYQIQKDLCKVNFLELTEMIEGPQALVKCAQKEESEACEIHQKCNITGPLASLSVKLNEFYRGLSLRDLLNGDRP